MIPMRFVCANLFNHMRWPHGLPVTKEQQLERLKERRADVYLFQETLGSEIDPYIATLGPQSVTFPLRLMASVMTTQNLAIITKHRIRRAYSIALGKFFADNIEVYPEYAAVGEELQAGVLAAEIEHREDGSRFLAATVHMAWTRQAHLGLKSHQHDALGNLREWLTPFIGRMPFVVMGDWNALIHTHVLGYFQDLAVTPLITKEHVYEVGTSLWLPQHQGMMQFLQNQKVYVDGGFCSRFEIVQPVEVIPEISDHLGHQIGLIQQARPRHSTA